MKVDRMLRVNAMLQQLLGEFLERDLRGFLPALTTVTAVKTSPDLKEAHVYVSVMGTPEQKQRALAVLADQRKHLQSGIAHSIKIKYTPILHFHLDESGERGDRVFSILHELNLDTAPAESAPPEPGPGPEPEPERPGQA
ncbi:MAG: 30S ribosome-binding factor RbfA [Lentisphaeria bacterium]|jgi:ribosome-binding factor A